MSLIDTISLKAIRQRRNALNLTQTELASLSGISQSTLNKIENESISPSFDTVKKIINALEQKEHSSEKTAKDVMHYPVISFSETSTVSEVSQKAKHEAISQFPVLRNGIIIGSISTNAILGAGKNERITKFIEGAFPTFGKETPVSVIISALKYAKATLVLEKGKIIGIITPEDLL